jgi:thioredoxin-related protein
MCLVAKPIVDGLERQLLGTAQVVRLDIVSSLGRSVARRHGVDGLPTILVFDGQGNVIYRQGGPPDKNRILNALQTVAP